MSNFAPILYNNLPTRTSIRVLHIEKVDPRRDGLSPHIRSSLSVVDLNSTPRFACLSYCWGDPRGLKRTNEPIGTASSNLVMSINSKEVSIKRNLFDALIHLWAITPTKLDPIWIDAVCINQEDLAERSQQVQLMRRIYSEAEEVLVWLGPATEREARAIPLIRTLAAVPPERSDQAQRRSNDDDPYEILGIPPLAPDELAVVRQFYEREWFRRTWVIQEAVLARHINFYLGMDQLSWEEIVQATDSVLGLSTIWHHPSLNFGLVHATLHAEYAAKAQEPSLNPLAWGATRMIKDLRRNLNRVSERYVFDQFIKWLAREKSATDPRDLIYGTLGIMAPMPGFVPDYKKDVQEVFTEFTNCIFRPHQGAKPEVALVVDQTVSDLKGLPSWVPDYTCTNPPRSLDTSARVFGELLGGLVPTSNSKVYGIRGIMIDVINEVGESYWEIKANAKLSSCLNLIGHIDQESLGCSSKGRLLANTLIGSRRSEVNEHPRKRVSFRNYLCWLKATKIKRTVQAQSSLESAVEQAYDELQILEEDWLPSRSEIIKCVKCLMASSEQESAWFKTARDHAYWYESNLDSFFDQRRFFVTRSGRPGIGPQSLKHGDEVWVIPQNSTPQILRREEQDRYFLLGEAFVYGIMDGPAVEKKTDKDLVDVFLI